MKLGIVYLTQYTRVFRHLARCRWGLRSSGMLR